MPKITVVKIDKRPQPSSGLLFHGDTTSIALVHPNSNDFRGFEVCINKRYCGERENLLLSTSLKYESIELYSDVSYDDFVAAFEEKFGKNASNFQADSCQRNCSYLVDWTLDYFFPELCLGIFYKTYQTLFSCFTAGFCGVDCCPVPPCLTSPADVFKKAALLQCKYGAPSPDEQKPLALPIKRLAS